MPSVCGDFGGVSQCSIPEVEHSGSNAFCRVAARLRIPKRRSVNALPYRLKWCGYGLGMHVPDRLESAGQLRLVCGDTWQ